jgi:hypothetical protein
MESGDSCGCFDVVMRDPQVFASIVAFPFHEVFESPIPHAAIQDLVDFVLCLAVNEDRVGGRSGSTTRDGVRRRWGQLYDRENRVKASK